MPTVCINFGHGPMNSGSNDPGAIGATGYQESTETREVGAKIVAKLKANGWDVLAIQDGDLTDVTNASNIFKADYFISIHADSFTSPDAHGITSFAYTPGGKGKSIAQAIQNDLVAATGLTDRGVKFANYWVLHYTDCPAVLVEIGFISNPAEEALMKSDAWDDKVASAICTGFSRAVGVVYSEMNGGNDVLDVAVLLFTKDDYWAGADVAAKHGNCAIFVRPSMDAKKAKTLIVVGGSSIRQTGEILLSGDNRYDTAAAVAKYLG